MDPLTPDQPNEPLPGPRLMADSARALDALVDRGFAELKGDAGDRERTERVSRLLSILDHVGGEGPAMLGRGELSRRSSLIVDLTVARVMRSAERDLAGRVGSVDAVCPLTARSVEAFDELQAREWESSGGPVAALLGLLHVGAATANARERLVDSTLGRIEREVEASRKRFRLEPERVAPAGRAGFRLREFVGAAAAVLFAASVLWPMLAGSREQARQSACTAGLSRAAMALSNYAFDYRGRLPQAQASFLGGTWWDVGRAGRSHSANLFVLVTNRYASLNDLACAGNAHAPTGAASPHDHDWRSSDEVSYSYQLPGPGRQGWGAGARFVVLTDRSPVVRRARLGERLDPDECSRNHAGRGQNVLFGDASVLFTTTPTLPWGDNVWLPATIAPRPLTGRETPASDDDAFVGP